LKQRTIEKNVVREVLNDLDIEPESKEASGLGWIAWKAIQPKNALQALTWPRRVALLALVLVALLSMPPVGRGARPLAGTHMQASSGHASQAAVPLGAEKPVPLAAEKPVPLATEKPVPLAAGKPASLAAEKPSLAAQKSVPSAVQKPAPLVAEHSDNSRRVTGPASKSETQFPTEATSTQPKKTSPTHVSSTTKSTVVLPRAGLAQPTDPTTLWTQVKNGSSEAEVELARIYLDGTGRERNCDQARVLLQDASRKGNTQAADLLADSARFCH